MLTTKIFHLHQPMDEARSSLRDLRTWNNSPHDAEIKCSAARAGGIAQFEFRTPTGQRLCADIEEVPGGEPNNILFRSVGGDVELAGLVEFFQIRPNLTEVVLTLDYEPESPLQKAFETIASAVDRFLNRQLARIEQARAADRAAGWSQRFA